MLKPEHFNLKKSRQSQTYSYDMFRISWVLGLLLLCNGLVQFLKI